MKLSQSGRYALLNAPDISELELPVERSVDIDHIEDLESERRFFLQLAARASRKLSTSEIDTLTEAAMRVAVGEYREQSRPLAIALTLVMCAVTAFLTWVAN